jgi:short-subunit dehydrogenase involved in D-alanine esterification of teichoic acids
MNSQTISEAVLITGCSTGIGRAWDRSMRSTFPQPKG